MEVQETILIECSRINSDIINYNQSLDNTNLISKTPNNKWSINLKENLVLNQGDEITIESTAINSINNGANQIEFSGQSQNKFISDNRGKLDIGYYINNNQQFNMPLPKYNACKLSLFNTLRWSRLQAKTNNVDGLLHTQNNTKYRIWSREYGSPFLEECVNNNPATIKNAIFLNHIPAENIEDTSIQNYQLSRPDSKRMYIMNDDLYDLYNNEDKIINGITFTNKADFKKNSVELNIEKGYHSVDNVSKVLTDDLHSLDKFTNDKFEFMPPLVRNSVNQTFTDFNNLPNQFNYSTSDKTNKIFPTSSANDIYHTSKNFKLNITKDVYTNGIQNQNEYTTNLGKLYYNTFTTTSDPFRLKSATILDTGILENKGLTIDTLLDTNEINETFLNKYNYYSGYKDSFTLTENGNIGCNIVIGDFLRSKLNLESEKIFTTPNSLNLCPIFTQASSESNNTLSQSLVDIIPEPSSTANGITGFNGNSININAIQFLDMKEDDIIFTNLIANDNNLDNIQKVIEQLEHPDDVSVNYNNNSDEYKKSLIMDLDIGATQDDNCADKIVQIYNLKFNNYSATSYKRIFRSSLPPPFINSIEPEASTSQSNSELINQNRFSNLNYVYGVFPSTSGSFNGITSNSEPFSYVGSNTDYNNYNEIYPSQYKGLFTEASKPQNEAYGNDLNRSYFLNKTDNLNEYGYKIKVRTRWTDDLDPQKTDMSGRLANNDSYSTTNDVITNSNVMTTKQSSLFSFQNSKGEYYDISKLKSRNIGVVVGFRKTTLNGIYKTNRGENESEIVNSNSWGDAAVFNTTQLDNNYNFVEISNKYLVNNKSNNYNLLSDNSLVDTNSILFRISDFNSFSSGLNEFSNTCAMGISYDFGAEKIPSKIQIWSRYIPNEAMKGFPIDVIVQGINNNSNTWDTLKIETNLTPIEVTSPVALTNQGSIILINTNAKKRYNKLRLIITKINTDIDDFTLALGDIKFFEIEQTTISPTDVGDEPSILKDVPFIGFVNKGNSRSDLRIPTPMIFEKFGISKSLNDIPRSCLTSTQKEGSTTTGFYDTATTLDKYVTYINIGAPLCNFNFTEQLGKIAINYLHNPIYSGQTQSNYNDCIEATPQPPINPTSSNQEQRVYFNDNIFKIQNGVGTSIGDDRNLSSAQCGIGILDLYVGVSTGNEYIKVERTNEDVIYPYSLFSKIGFDYQQLISPYKNCSLIYSRNHQVKYLSNTNDERSKYDNMLYPITTNGLVSSGNNIGLTTNQQGFPLFLIGNSNFKQTSIIQTPDFILPQNFPIKSSYPYLLVRSNIIQNNKNFIAGNGNSQSIIAVINKAYDSNDYFYTFANDWNYTVDKHYVLSDIDVEILTPNNLLPAPIDENSSIIFKIIRNKLLYNEENINK